MNVLGHHVFRVTRDTDFELSDESEDLLSAIEVVLQQRTKFGRSVRLEVDTSMTAEVLDLLCRELELEPDEVSVIDAPLDLGGLWSLYELPRDDLKYPPWRGVVPPGLEGDDIFADIRAGDVLVHLPYESFAASVEAFVAAAARDPRVLAIKQTLYRAGGDEAGIVASLAKAAREGKQVVTLVELKARFDEQANIERARSLEQAGVHVVYGLVGLKTHCKVLLVVRQEAEGIRRYCHVGTGNYNPKTATLYEDLGVFSADPALGADLSELFNYLTGYGRPRALRRLIVAPSSLRPELMRRIAEQARPGGRIVMKMNALVDPELIDAFYEANRKGAQIDLLIRGICCLRPEVPGLSENIRVRSIVGRFLEHSRIFRFGPREGPAEYLIGSADLMPRNLDRRIEALLTVTGPSLQARLDEILEVGLADDVGAWELTAQGTWRKVRGGAGVELQRRLQELALARAQARSTQPPAGGGGMPDVEPDVQTEIKTELARIIGDDHLLNPSHDR
jgi:polyphosphate kinase